MKNKVDVRICGMDYTLVGTESDEYIQRVALYVDKKMNEIMRCNSSLSTSMAAILSAVNVADDLHKASENESSLRNELKRTQEELQRLRNENRSLMEENAGLRRRDSNLQVELVKKEAELKGVRSTLERFDGARV